tara:strand:- start:217 stop:591 length:375 start_codon:yes stop_codon:yes gene_type:complete
MNEGTNQILVSNGTNHCNIISSASPGTAPLISREGAMTETTFTTRQALDALGEELRTQRFTDPYFRFRATHAFHTAWAEMWRGGMWIRNRVGDSERAMSLRAAMSEAELEEFNRLLEHYGGAHH